MAYWVKLYEQDDWTYNSDGDRLEYQLQSYAGPFRDIICAEEYLKDNHLNGATVLEFE